MTKKALCSCLLAATLLSLTILPVAGAAQIDDRDSIDLSLQNAPLPDVLQSFAKISGGELKADPEITGSVTVELKQVPWTQALDNICRIHRLSCEMLAGEPPVLRVRKLDAGDGGPRPCRLPGFAEPINLSLKNADLRAMLESLEIVAGRAVVIDDELSGAVTMHVRQAPWNVVFTEICLMSGCRIEWGEEEIRIVAASAQRRLHALDLSLSQADLRVVLKSFAKLPIFCSAGALEVEIAEELTGSVSLELKNAPWSVAVEEICERAGCVWEVTYGEPPVLRFSARDSDAARDSHLGEAAAVLNAHPPAGAEPPAVAVRFQPPGPAAAVEGEVSFSWTRPIHVIEAAGDDPWQLRLTWIPFGPELHIVLPVLVRCGEAKPVPTMFDPVKVPLVESWKGRRGGARLELSPATGGSRAGHLKPVEDCLSDPELRVEARIRRAGSEGTDRELKAEVGTYLLVTPPASEPKASPTAAVVGVGHDGEGRQLVAVVTPAASGSGVEVERLTIRPGDGEKRIIRAADGREFELELRVVEAAGKN